MNLSELLTRPERPCPELEACLRQDPALGWIIKHPLVVDIMVDPERCARQNAMLASKRERIEAALAAGDWATVLGMYERPFRFQALCKLTRDCVEAAEFAKAVAWTWCDSENLHENVKGWQRLWRSRGLVRDAVMQPDELAAYKALPATIVAWRGYQQPKGCAGLSWTLSEDVALWFARRWREAGAAGFLASAHVPVSEVTALFLRRGEQEVVIPKMPVGDVRLSLRRV